MVFFVLTNKMMPAMLTWTNEDAVHLTPTTVEDILISAHNFEH